MSSIDRQLEQIKEQLEAIWKCLHDPEEIQKMEVRGCICNLMQRAVLGRYIKRGMSVEDIKTILRSLLQRGGRTIRDVERVALERLTDEKATSTADDGVLLECDLQPPSLTPFIGRYDNDRLSFFLQFEHGKLHALTATCRKGSFLEEKCRKINAIMKEKKQSVDAAH